MAMQYMRVQISGDAIVVAFDMCSSSNIIEELTLSGNLKRLNEFLTALKRYLASAQKNVVFDPYKFMGDGWILLFPAETDGKVLFKFLQDLCTFFRREFRQQVLKHLATPPSITGLTFGVEKGPLVSMTMYGQREYIGRALNIACRLQSAIKYKDSSPAYKALVSNDVFNDYFASATRKVTVYKVRRRLRNIRGGDNFHCKKIHLLSSNTT
jgi:class 3 adenylate cyclase